MNYTKGGWKAQITKDPLRQHDKVKIGKTIALINTDVKEHEANTYLISAAPDMYEVLKKIYRQLESGYIVNDSKRADIMRFKLESQVKQVLTKAEGKV